MSVTLDEETIDVGAITTATVAVDEASGGVGAAELSVSVGDTSVATIADVDVLGEGASNGESTYTYLDCLVGRIPVGIDTGRRER